MLTGGQIIVKALQDNNVKRISCVAGESYLPVLDALLDAPEIDVITCRHESGAAFMAESWGALYGYERQPGIAMVTRGPGVANATIGIHSAMQASTPMIVLVGLVNMDFRDREAFQEFDLARIYGGWAKWAAVIDRTDRIAEYMARAFHVALSGRPGPVVLGLPEDILTEQSDMVEMYIAPESHSSPSPIVLKELKEKLSAAQKPLIITGGSCWSDQACADLEQFAGSAHIPAATSFRRQDLFNHNNGNYIGELGTGPNPALIERCAQADTVLVIGARLNEITTQGYSLLSNTQTVLHIYPGAEEFGKAGLSVDMCVQSHVGPFLSALAAGFNVDGRNWAGWRDDARKEYLDWTQINGDAPTDWKGADMTMIFDHLRSVLPDDAIVTTDAGNFSGWAQRYLKYGRPGRLLAPVSGAMGYAVPSAVGAALSEPDRLVVGLCGDGGFMMTASELATAAHHGAKPIILVCNNGIYGAIRMHQERDYPSRHSATSLTNPDFVIFAESFGAFAARVDNAAQFPDIFDQARQSGKAAVIEIMMDPDQITTRSAK